MSKATNGQAVVVTVGAYRGETGVIAGKVGAGWSVRLASGKTVTLASTSFKRGAA